MSAQPQPPAQLYIIINIADVVIYQQHSLSQQHKHSHPPPMTTPTTLSIKTNILSLFCAAQSLLIHEMHCEGSEEQLNQRSSVSI